jgi:hypothetical protein
MTRPIRSRRIAHQKARLRRTGIVQLPRKFFEQTALESVTGYGGGPLAAKRPQEI